MLFHYLRDLPFQKLGHLRDGILGRQVYMLDLWIIEVRSKTIVYDVLNSTRDEYFCIPWQI
jgi:hypothetical protein